jgi:hypothetical protein
VHLNLRGQPLHERRPEKGGGMLAGRAQLQQVHQQKRWPAVTQIRRVHQLHSFLHQQQMVSNEQPVLQSLV